MANQVQTEKSKSRKEKQAADEIIDQIEEKKEETLKTKERQRITHKRIEGLKKAFKSQWLIKQINSVDDKKGK